VERDRTPAEEMNRELYLAPELVEGDEDDEDPLLEQARENVEDEGGQ